MKRWIEITAAVAIILLVGAVDFLVVETDHLRERLRRDGRADSLCFDKETGDLTVPHMRGVTIPVKIPDDTVIFYGDTMVNIPPGVHQIVITVIPADGEGSAK